MVLEDLLTWQNKKQEQRERDLKSPCPQGFRDAAAMNEMASVSKELNAKHKKTEHKNCGLSFYTLASLCACLYRQIILVYSLPFCVTKNTFKSMQGNDAPRPRQHNSFQPVSLLDLSEGAIVTARLCSPVDVQLLYAAWLNGSMLTVICIYCLFMVQDEDKRVEHYCWHHCRAPCCYKLFQLTDHTMW